MAKEELVEDILVVARRLLTIGPSYRPQMKNGWVRRYHANKLRLKRNFERLDRKEPS